MQLVTRFLHANNESERNFFRYQVHESLPLLIALIRDFVVVNAQSFSEAFSTESRNNFSREAERWDEAQTDMIIALLLLLFWIIYRQSWLQNKQIAGVLYNFPDEIVFKVKSNDIGRSMISFLITEMEVH